jgi:hypothetical protein
MAWAACASPASRTSAEPTRHAAGAAPPPRRPGGRSPESQGLRGSRVRSASRTGRSVRPAASLQHLRLEECHDPIRATHGPADAAVRSLDGEHLRAARVRSVCGSNPHGRAFAPLRLLRLEPPSAAPIELPFAQPAPFSSSGRQHFRDARVRSVLHHRGDGARAAPSVRHERRPPSSSPPLSRAHARAPRAAALPPPN